MEWLIGLFLCLMVGFALVVGAIVWLVLRGVAPHSRPASPPAPAEPTAEPGDLDALDKLVARWAAAGHLETEVAARVRALIAAERQAGKHQPAPPALEQPASGVGRGAAAASAQPVALASPVAASGPGSKGGRLAQPSLGAALLALGTRRTLLFLGAFLLITSSLTLVVFNWASFPPIMQLAILAGTTVAVWAGGAWMSKQPDLQTAGHNLQAIAALLLPVVGFALGRPGLLDLAPRSSWLLASALSLVLYSAAAWRTRRAFYSGAAALAATSLVLAALGDLAPGWQPAPLIALFAAMTPLVAALRRAGESRLAAGPRWVALLGGPLALAAAALLYLVGEPAPAFATALALGALFCGLCYWLEGRAPWLWCASGLPAIALQIALIGVDLSLPLQVLSLALSALAYLGLCVALERRFAPALRPLFVAAIVLAIAAASGAAVDAEAARIVLPWLVLFGLALSALVEGGRLAWLGRERGLGATIGLGGAAFLFPIWLAVLLERRLPIEQIGLTLLPVGAIYYAGARWWPGRLRVSYDAVLQALGTIVVAVAWSLTVFDGETRLAGAFLVGLIFGGQALARRFAPWSAASLSALACAAALAVERFVALDWRLRVLTLVALTLAYLYTIGGERLRRAWPVSVVTTGGAAQVGRLAYWSWPGVGIGSLSGFLAGALALLQVESEPGLFCGVLAGLAALLALHTALWRRAELGYGVATLLALAVVVAAAEGFFTGWQPAAGDLAYVVCATASGLALIGQGLRRFGRRYGLPYEHTAFVALPLAPLLAGNDQAHLCATWSALAILYMAALWRYRLAWMLSLAFVALDWALLHGAAWLAPGGDPAGAGVILAAAVAAQSLFCTWASRRSAFLRQARLWGYLSAAIGGVGALLLVNGDPGASAGVAGLFTLVLAVIVTTERREEPAWAALGMLVLALVQLHRLLVVEPSWSGAWLVFELMGVSLAGWAAVRAGQGQWRRPTGVGAVGVALLAVAGVGGLSLGADLTPLTFALASLGLLLATLAVRERELYYAYAAGAALVGAMLCQLADWGFEEPQWYVVPAGLYLLALAWGLRRFQGQRRASRLIEGAAAALLLGLTFGQALLGPGGPLYSLLLFGEALAMAAYGALARLRAPFVGGVGFFVLGALWIAVDAAQLVNQWVLLGAVGLLMVAAYVILERHQERLVRAGRQWAAQLQSWG